MSYPNNDEEYEVIESYLDKLIDETRDDENHPLAQAMLIIGENLEEYERTNHPGIGSDVTDIEIIKYLMEENDLTQKDLIDIFGNQGNVSKFLNAERTLSKTQIIKIRERFSISADFFMRS